MESPQMLYQELSNWCSILQSGYLYTGSSICRHPVVFTYWQFMMAHINVLASHNIPQIVNVIIQSNQASSPAMKLIGSFSPLSWKNIVEPLKGFTSVKFYPQNWEIKSEWAFFHFFSETCQKMIIKEELSTAFRNSPSEFSHRFLGNSVINDLIQSEARRFFLYF